MARVLVVDDDPDLLALVDIQLRHRGHRVATARSAQEALELVAERGAPEVAVLDVAMAGMNGLDLLKALRATDGMTDLPAVFLSARVNPNDIEAGRQLGAEYLTKPYVLNALLAVIDRLTTISSSPESGW